MSDGHDWLLGVWDGHDSGAALLRDGAIAFAVNEERLTRRKLEVRHTTGSTGSPLAFYCTLEVNEYIVAGLWRNYRRCGWQPGEKIACIWGFSPEHTAMPACKPSSDSRLR